MNSNQKIMNKNKIKNKKTERGEIKKEFQFYKLLKIKKIIKRIRIKYKELTNWKIVLKYVEDILENLGRKGAHREIWYHDLQD